MTRQLPFTEIISGIHLCTVKRSDWPLRYLPVDRLSARVVARCGHSIHESYQLSIGGRALRDCDPITIPFTLLEQLFRRSSRTCLNCEQQDQLPQILVCPQCEHLISPGENVFLGPHSSGAQGLRHLYTRVIESGEIVRCANPACSAGVQHRQALWNGKEIAISRGTPLERYKYYARHSPRA